MYFHTSVEKAHSQHSPDVFVTDGILITHIFLMFEIYSQMSRFSDNMGPFVLCRRDPLVTAMATEHPVIEEGEGVICHRGLTRSNCSWWNVNIIYWLSIRVSFKNMFVFRLPYNKDILKFNYEWHYLFLGNGYFLSVIQVFEVQKLLCLNTDVTENSDHFLCTESRLAKLTKWTTFRPTGSMF